MPKGIGYGLGRPTYPRSTKGMNDPQHPKAGPSAPGPKDTSGGVSLTAGYNKLGDAGRSPRAVAQNK